MLKNTTIQIPTISTAPPARKVSATNLATLLNGLELILNLRSTSEMTNDLIAILTSIHGQLITCLEADAEYTIKLYKALAHWWFNYLRTIRLGREGFEDKQWSITYNCPTLLTELVIWYDSHLGKGVVTSNPDLWFHVQIVYAFLNGHRVIITPMKVNTTTITEPLGVKELPNLVDKIPLACKALGITPAEFQRVYKANCANARLNIVTSAGPNGQATWTADLDAKAIMANPSVFINMKNFCANSNLKWILPQIVGCVNLPQNDPKITHNKTPVVGKILPLEEWGGKTRVVAILDYWTQAVLSPLHDTVAYFIRRLEADGTFDQDKIINKVRTWTGSAGIRVDSFDLTAATDRIPIDLQVDALTYLMGSDTLPKLWKGLLVDRDFIGPDGEILRYAVGQPMGAKSSFPMLGLIHHILVKIAAINAKVDKYTNYVILGDDNSHGDPKVALAYRTLMESIGVEINLSKSVRSGENVHNSAEICKRTFINGMELTGVPVKALVKTAKYGYMASTLQDLITKRGNVVLASDMLTFFGGLIDRRSLQGIAVLNKVPTTISGLLSNFEITNPSLDYSKWFDKIMINDEFLEHAFLYALVTEQLKRVDGLLRGTLVMAETVQAMANPDVAKLWPNELFMGMSESQKALEIAKLPTLTWGHPIHLASISELDRVMSHLAALRSGSKAMKDKARKGLLDLLRNNLAEIWLGEPEKSAIVRRSIFNAMLASLKRMNNLALSEGETRALNFSILLSHVQRMWSVHWAWGSPPVINAVKTKIEINVVSAGSKVDGALSDITMRELRI